MNNTMFDLDSITIIDDDIETAEVVRDLIEDLGLGLQIDLITDGPYDMPEQIVEEVLSRGGNRGIVCDHRLQHQGLASFYGSELLAKFYNRGIPGTLVTQFSEVDADTSIRQFRQWVPAMIDREFITTQAIIYGLSVCQEEIKGNLLISRRAHRTLISIVNISREDDQVVADAFIPGWNSKHAVRFPMNSIQADIQQNLIDAWENNHDRDKRIITFAMVNIGAKDSTELFFHDFEAGSYTWPVSFGQHTTQLIQMLEELVILDVAHGNTALLFSSGQTAVLDAAPKTVLIDALEFYGINTIDYIFISHSDYDHMGGVMNLLTDKNLLVKNLYVNPDASKNTVAWIELSAAVNDAFKRYQLSVYGLNASMRPLEVGQAHVNVLYPLPGDALMAVNRMSTTGKKMTSNATSSVLMVTHADHNVALFAGDVEQNGLDAMIESKCDMQADVLIFPHHGGHVGGNMQQFATSLTQQVQPKITIFSIGRNYLSNPNPAIVSAVKAVAPNTHIMCTQLSTNCYAGNPPLSMDWTKQISEVPGIGVETNSSCSGTVRIELAGSNSIFHLVNEHRDFVTNNIPGRLCK